MAVKRSQIEPDHPQISIQRQCELIGLPRSSWYYSAAQETPYNEHLMQMIDQQFTETPFYGIRRMTAWLHTQGKPVNHKRVARLMRKMGLAAIYPKPNLSRPADNARHYPDLLRELPITGPNQVWSTDITSIRLAQGVIYLVAVIDWFSRYVLSWQVSNTMDVGFCLAALEPSLEFGQPATLTPIKGRNSPVWCLPNG